MPSITLKQGDALKVLADYPDNSIDAVVTDPPYGLSNKEPDIAKVLQGWLSGADVTPPGGGFMGKTWDSIVPGPILWGEVQRVLKPGGYALVFAGARTVDLMGISLRLAGFEIRDEIMWLYGQGWPKGQNVGKQLEKEGHPDSEQWEGWHTQLKPGHEPILVARKPLAHKVTTNVTEFGTGAYNVDGCRIEAPEGRPLIEGDYKATDNNAYDGRMDGSLQGGSKNGGTTTEGRFPSNVVMSHTEDCTAQHIWYEHDDKCLRLCPPAAGYMCVDGCPILNPPPLRYRCAEGCPIRMLDEQTGTLTSGGPGTRGAAGAVNSSAAFGAESRPEGGEVQAYGDSGGASRFFYCSKAAKSERNAGLAPGDSNKHPTVKPVDLMRYLVRLVTPPGGTVLDPFVGSGTTALAAALEGFSVVGIDRDDDNVYIQWAADRLTGAGFQMEVSHLLDFNMEIPLSDVPAEVLDLLIGPDGISSATPGSET